MTAPPNLDHPPVIIEKSRAKSFGMFLIASGFVAIAALLAPREHGRELVETIAAGAFFGLSLPLFGWNSTDPTV